MHVLLLLVELLDIWSAVAGVKTVLMLVAFALAVVLGGTVAYLRSKRRKIPTAFWAMILVLVLIGVGFTLVHPDNHGDIYRVRVTVLNSERHPVEDAIVWSSFGGEAKKVAAGWQFDIPSASKPQDGKVTFYATRDISYEAGEAELDLATDFNSAVTIKMDHPTSAKVRGQVVDRRNQGVTGARVFITGYDSEAIVTKEGGNFILPAHAAVDQQVLLHAEKAGYRAVSQWHPAGDYPATLVLEK